MLTPNKSPRDISKSKLFR